MSAWLPGGLFSTTERVAGDRERACGPGRLGPPRAGQPGILTWGTRAGPSVPGRPDRLVAVRTAGDVWRAVLCLAHSRCAGCERCSHSRCAGHGRCSHSRCPCSLSVVSVRGLCSWMLVAPAAWELPTWGNRSWPACPRCGDCASLSGTSAFSHGHDTGETARPERTLLRGQHGKRGLFPGAPSGGFNLLTFSGRAGRLPLRLRWGFGRKTLGTGELLRAGPAGRLAC